MQGHRSFSRVEMRKQISQLLSPEPPPLGLTGLSRAKSPEKGPSEQASPEKKIFHVLGVLSDPWSQ